MRALATRAEVKPSLLTANDEGYRMNVWQTLGVRSPLRMANIMAEHRALAAQVTLQVISPLDHKSGLQ